MSSGPSSGGTGVTHTGSSRHRRGRFRRRPNRLSRPSEELEEVDEEPWPDTRLGSGKALINAVDSETHQTQQLSTHGTMDRSATPSAEPGKDVDVPTGEKAIYLTNLKINQPKEELWKFFRKNFKELELAGIETDNPGRRDGGPCTASVYFKRVQDAITAANAPRNMYDLIAGPGTGRQKFRVRWYPDQEPPLARSLSNPILSFANLTTGPPSAHSAPPNASGSSQLSPVAQTFTPRNQLSNTAPHLTSSNRPDGQAWSPVLSIAPINPALTREQITDRLINILSPTYSFESKPIQIRSTRRVDIYRYTFIRFPDSKDAAEAKYVIHNGDLNRNNAPVDIRQIGITSEFSRYLTSEVRLDNVPISWTTEYLCLMLSNMVQNHGLAGANEVAPRYQGTKSYDLICDFPNNALALVDRLHGRTLGGSNVLDAVARDVLWIERRRRLQLLVLGETMHLRY